MTPKRKVTIAAGSTWSDSFTWLKLPYNYRDVETVENGLPTKFTVQGHGLPIGSPIPISISNSGSLKLDTTTDSAPVFAVAEDEDVLVLHGIDTIKRPVSTTTPRIVYLTPVLFDGYTARVQFKTSLNGPALVTLTEESGIILAGSLVTLNLTTSQTRTLVGAATDTVTGIAQLELTSPTGATTRILQYDWSASVEWTKEG